MFSRALLEESFAPFALHCPRRIEELLQVAPAT
jgi:hypothetical protein